MEFLREESSLARIHQDLINPGQKPIADCQQLFYPLIQIHWISMSKIISYSKNAKNNL